MSLQTIFEGGVTKGQLKVQSVKTSALEAEILLGAGEIIEGLNPANSVRGVSSSLDVLLPGNLFEGETYVVFWSFGMNATVGGGQMDLLVTVDPTGQNLDLGGSHDLGTVDAAGAGDVGATRTGFTSFAIITAGAGANKIIRFNVSGGAGTNRARLRTTLLAAQRTFDFPDQGGTIALTGDLTGFIGGSITDNQIAIGASVAEDIEGSSNFTWDGSDLIMYEAVNDGNPTINIGSSATNR